MWIGETRRVTFSTPASSREQDGGSSTHVRRYLWMNAIGMWAFEMREVGRKNGGCLGSNWFMYPRYAVIKIRMPTPYAVISRENVSEATKDALLIPGSAHGKPLSLTSRVSAAGPHDA